MNRSKPKRWVASCASVFALGAFATLASGIPVVASGPFSLPQNQQLAIWQPASPAPMAAVRVTTANGTVRVRSNDGANHPLGLVPAGRACIFEGPFPQVNLIADAGSATNGSWEVRAPTDGPDVDRLVGSGTLNLGASGGTYSPYGFYTAAGAAASTHRLIAIDASANAAEVWVTAKDAANNGVGPTYIVDEGDWGFCSRGISKFSVTGSNTVPFAVYDPTPTGNPVTGVFRAQTVGDTDSVSADGLRNLEIGLVNNGSGAITLTYMLKGGAQQQASVPAGQSAPPVTGPISKYEWTYQTSGCTVTVSVKGAR